MGAPGRGSYGAAMDTTSTASTDRPVRSLQRWMRAVGGFYLLLGLFNTPPVISARLPSQYPELGVAVTSAPAQALVDVWFMFGLEVAVIGAALLLFSRSPLQHVALVWTVIGLELVRGVFDDLYLIARGADPVFYGVFALVHLAIIVTGVVLTRRAQHGSQRRLGTVDA